MNVRCWFVVVIHTDHMDRTYEFIDRHICTQYVSIIVCISDWEVFSSNTLSVLQHDILSRFDSCEFGKLFTPRMTVLHVFTNLLNQVGCKSVRAHIFFCQCISGQKCQMCTKLNCHIDTHSRILTELDLFYLSEVMREASRNLRLIFELLGSYISLNCFKDHRKINDGVVSEVEQNFSDQYPPSVNIYTFFDCSV